MNKPTGRIPNVDFSNVEPVTNQADLDEARISTIMDRYLKRGILPKMNTKIARYGDFEKAPDFREAQDLVIRARDQFAALPSSIRAKFDNDPAKLLDFVHDPNNLEAAQELGLLNEEGNKKVADKKATQAKDKEPTK